jgi:2,4-dienoyl-CoA reductase-like NADH-dependent reductase (Old Yellow Enzyme family)
MSVLFEPMKIGKLEVKNRFVRSAVVEGRGKENGEISDDCIKMYQTLAKGGVGLIISGSWYPQPLGRMDITQIGIHSDEMLPGLKRLTDIIHETDAKIAFQISHAGSQTYKELIGTLPLAPSKRILNPSTQTKPKEMNESEIDDVISGYVEAAKRAEYANADAIQLHAAHGYMINEFISPYYNVRKDDWGGSEENRFRFFKEMIIRIKDTLKKDTPILVKLNANDYTRKPGITPPLAATYAKWLTELGIDGIEISCGSPHFAIFNMSRGDVPVKEFSQAFPDQMKPLVEKFFGDMKGKYDLEEGYNLEAAKQIKPVIGDLPLMLVGGLRKLAHMEEIVKNKYADFISLARPLIKEPFLINDFKTGKKDEASCISCNRCLAAISNDFPVICYEKKFPEKNKN